MKVSSASARASRKVLVFRVRIRRPLSPSASSAEELVTSANRRSDSRCQPRDGIDLSLWPGTVACELEINRRYRGRSSGAVVLVSRCQVLKAVLDEGIGRLVCQFAHGSGASLLKFWVQHE
jgi:hypothetical protein